MKQLTLRSSKQSGFTLLETLISLGIFSIVALGSATAISRMLHTQKDMQESAVIIQLMQNKLQQALNRSGTGSVCDAVNKDNFIVAAKTYYIACGTERINVNSTVIEWPVLAVSADQAAAQSCASGSVSTSCYVVGR
jgi:prepilin-type N-terminal cleavage/methylation domain-containing protein